LTESLCPLLARSSQTVLPTGLTEWSVTPTGVAATILRLLEVCVDPYNQAVGVNRHFQHSDFVAKISGEVEPGDRSPVVYLVDREEFARGIVAQEKSIEVETNAVTSHEVFADRNVSNDRIGSRPETDKWP